jgi:hypothetical protein
LTYIDTSVLIAYYCPEPLSAQAQRALQEQAKPAISWLVELELVSALARKVRARGMRRADARRVLAMFQSHLDREIYSRLAVEALHFGVAREWLASLAVLLQTLDALHVAVAALHGCPIVTADAALARACTKVGVTARLIV